jgi:DNA-directed RNA polymerase subunit H (RpoH/RPB5)
MAKFNKNMLKDVKNALFDIKRKEQEENKEHTVKQTKLTLNQKQKIRQESLNDHKVKVTWNINPGDLVKINRRSSPTGKELYGLVTWGIKKTEQRAPTLGWTHNLKSYNNNVRVMSSAGYLFLPANAMMVIS